MATEQSSPEAEGAALRKQARWRSHFWPGSGFALLGHPGLAFLGAVIIALMPAALLCLLFTFHPLFFWSFIASLGVYLCFYLAEQFWCRSIVIYPGGERRFLSRFLVPLCAVGYLGVVGVVVFFFLNIGSARIGGQGMMPTLHPGDFLMYRKQVVREHLRPGHFVYFRTSADSAWGKGGDLVVARILAIPGDEMSIEGDHYLLNGKQSVRVGPLGKFRASIEIPKAPKALKVPDSCYFIIQDNSQDSFDSRVLSWARESNMVSTQAIVLVGHEFGRVVE